MKGIKLKNPKLPKAKMPTANQPKLPKLRFSGKKNNFGEGDNYYTKIFKK